MLWLGLERGGEARRWLAEQSTCDVWQTKRRFKATQMDVQPAPELEVFELFLK